jgi:hypothetical protein
VAQFVELLMHLEAKVRFKFTQRARTVCLLVEQLLD